MGKVLEQLSAFCKIGMTTAALDAEAERLILACGGSPAFKGYHTGAAPAPFPASVCVSLNDELVHGIPSRERIIKVGDVVSLDIGMKWAPKKIISRKKNIDSGVFTDTAVTFIMGKPKSEAVKLLDVTRQSLEAGIKAAQPGSSVAAIGKAVESYVKSQGNYGIVRDLVGHGVGHAVHEEPYIPNYYDPSLENIKLVPGMVIAIEPMIALGDWRVVTKPDGWTIKMKDNSLCAHFEHTLIITNKGNIVVTRRPEEK